jgi:uncharacterized protein (DUF1800 family)
MKTIIFILLSFISVNSYALTIAEARHFLSRTGFPPSFQEIQPYLELTKTQAIDRRLAEIEHKPEMQLPDFLRIPYRDYLDQKKLTPTEKKTYRKKLQKETLQLKDWWMTEILITQSPATENLTLFWHNHFSTSAQKIKQPALLAQQNLTLRFHAAGNFKTFVKSMIKDPALILYLDNQQNKTNKPNENLARELLELFTLGEGHYTENDIKEAARALSGYGIEWHTGRFSFREKKHDKRLKTILDNTGKWNGDDLIDLIFDNKQTAKFITSKLWQHFITTPINDKSLNQLANNFYKNYEIKPLISSILKQPQFWEIGNIGTQVKSPIQLVAGLYRQLEITTKNPRQLVQSASSMGLNLFTPPNVKGWASNEEWINTNSLLKRKSFIQNNLRGMKIPRAVQKQNQPYQAWLDLLIANTPQQKSVHNAQTQKTVENLLNDLRYQLQ